MKVNAITWFEIYVSDMPRAKSFYEAVLGCTLKSLEAPDGAGASDSGSGGPGGPGGMEMWTFPAEMELPGAGGALVKMEGGPAGGSEGVMIYFECDDCATQAARIQPAGGTLNCPKVAIGQYGFMAHGIDTEGNMIGLHSMK